MVAKGIAGWYPEASDLISDSGRCCLSLSSAEGDPKCQDYTLSIQVPSRM